MTGVDVIPFQISLDESVGVAPSAFLSITDYPAKTDNAMCQECSNLANILGK